MTAMAGHKYRVIKRLEAGGMAEVFFGEAKGVQGFKKWVAIKRVLPHLAQNENFIQMFLDEARLSARLNHANIVTVFDIEPWKDTYQLIMEFVDGANLKRITDSLQSRGCTVPLAEAAYICIEACRALSYAHELHDENCIALNIVHRDISPPNIMVTKRGEVKVADFGLAKAGTQLSQTDPGVVKGKFGYLSPEAAEGREVDARADIFALGVVLWEMLAGRRLFLGESDYATVKLVQKANVPRLSPLNSEVDEVFEEILLRALTRDPVQRYQSAEEFGNALTSYLFSRQLKVTSYDLAALVQTATTSGEPNASSNAKESSLIHRLIQEELDESILQSSDPSIRPAVEEEAPTAPPGELEDPASWFSEEELAAAGPQPEHVPSNGARPPHSGSWHEAGLDVQELAESSGSFSAHAAPNTTRRPPSAQLRPAYAQSMADSGDFGDVEPFDATPFEDDNEPTVVAMPPSHASAFANGQSHFGVQEGLHRGAQAVAHNGHRARQAQHAVAHHAHSASAAVMRSTSQPPRPPVSSQPPRLSLATGPDAPPLHGGVTGPRLAADKGKRSGGGAARMLVAAAVVVATVIAGLLAIRIL